MSRSPVVDRIQQLYNATVSMCALVSQSALCESARDEILTGELLFIPRALHTESKRLDTRDA